MQKTDHPANRGRLPGLERIGRDDEFAFRPSDDEVTPERRSGRVQRDTNADGWFTQADINGVQALNNSFKIHPGSHGNTDSAGCQTIHPDDYDNFLRAVAGIEDLRNLDRDIPQTQRWQYVLTNTTPGMFRDVNRDQNQDQNQNIEHRQHVQPAAPNRGVPARDGVPDHGQHHNRQAGVLPFSFDPMLSTPEYGHVNDPRDINHPDHTMNQGVREQVRSLYAEHGLSLTDQQLDCTTACVMADARRSGMTKVTALEFSEDYATGKPDLNGNLIAYQGDPNNPATRYSATETQRAATTPPEDSYRQFEQTTQEQAQVQAQFLAQQEQVSQSRSGPVHSV